MVIRTLSSFGCRILAYDKYLNEEAKKYATYVDGPTFARESDIIILHCSLTPETHHIEPPREFRRLIAVSHAAMVDSASRR